MELIPGDRRHLAHMGKISMATSVCVCVCVCVCVEGLTFHPFFVVLSTGKPKSSGFGTPISAVFLFLPTCIYLYLYLYLPVPTSAYLPVSPCIYLYLTVLSPLPCLSDLCVCVPGDPASPQRPPAAPPLPGGRSHPIRTQAGPRCGRRPQTRKPG